MAVRQLRRRGRAPRLCEPIALGVAHVRLELRRHVFAPPSVVWDVLTDWERQAAWMQDALSVRVVGAQREGVGVRIVCPTDLFGVIVEDRMVVTGWEPPVRLAVRHVGRVITGDAAFILEPTPVGTLVVWEEDVDPPLGVLGELGARIVVRPYARRLFERGLDAFAALCEGDQNRPFVPTADGPDRAP